MHRRQILRAAPEQVRFATSEERTVLATPQAELLGIKDLIDKGQLQSKQFLDLVSQSYPNTEGGAPDAPAQDEPPPADVPGSVTPTPPGVSPESAEPQVVSESQVREDASISQSQAEPQAMPSSSNGVSSDGNASSSSTYGPMRRRITGKDGPFALWRPAPLSQDDFVSIMKEVVPQLVDEATQGTKRSHDESEPSSDAVPSPASQRPRTSEVLSVQEVNDLLDVCDNQGHEAFVASYMKKAQVSKEIHHSNNPPELQRKVDEGKRLEWATISQRPDIVKVHYGQAAARIREHQSHRFIGSRFVLTRKACTEGAPVDPEDLSTFQVKGRWCLQGHLDPDLTEKAHSGSLKSPTLSQLGRMLLMQMISSHGWQLQLGDIKGAFLEAGPLDSKYRPLYASQPPGGIPGLPPSAVIEVLGNIYGCNDAPASWFKEFSTVLKEPGWIQSQYDSCLFQLRDPNTSSLIGCLGVHVDDTALGGTGSIFAESVRKLRERFPYRKWRIGSGEFCGAWYDQADDFSITMNMGAFVDKLRPVNLPKQAPPTQLLDPHQVKVLRAVNGSLNWLASQSRPDLSAQTSLSQQSFPNPTIQDLRVAGQAVRRAKQGRDVSIVFRPIKPSDLTLCCHSDAAWANVGNHTQAGFVIGFTEKKLQDGAVATWVPAAWRSYKLPRAVNSTLSAEAQSLATATGTVEWLSLLISELLDGPTPARKCREMLSKRPPLFITDCKSLYDHLVSPSAPTTIDDRRTSIDVIIIRESAKATNAFVRWVPTQHMLADGLTKDAGEPIELLKVCMRHTEYHISPESVVLARQAHERAQKKLRQQKSEQ